ncbi:ribonuclease H-like domain-containing protein, partial [Tanacetum coccineum]
AQSNNHHLTASVSTTVTPGSTGSMGQKTTLPHAFDAGILHDLTTGAWNIDTGHGDLYLVTTPSPIPHAFLVSQHTWHQRLGHPGSEPIHQLDVKNAFLHGDLSETLYVHQPLGSRDSVHLYYGMDIAYLLLYVDDIVLTASSETLLQQIIASLHMEFSMMDMGSLNYFLVERAHMVNCNPSQTPVDTESKLVVDRNPVSNLTLYQSLTGSLQYVTFTRPDISYVVQQIMGCSCFPLVLQIWLLIQMRIGLVALLLDDRPLVTMFLGNNLLSCSSKRQPTLSHSSAEAEYHNVANVVAETCWLCKLLHELYTTLSSSTLVYCDNVSAVYFSSNLVQHQRMKHIEIDIHFVRDLVAAVQI